MARPGRPVSQEVDAESADIRSLLTIQDRARANTRRTTAENEAIVAHATEIITIVLRYHPKPPARSPARKTTGRVKKRGALPSNGADA